MTVLYFDRSITDEQRRRGLCRGEVCVNSPTDAGRELCRLAREVLVEAFEPYDPELAQYSMAVEDYVAALSDLKPRFINHPEAKEHIRSILAQYGCDLDKTYFDVLRLRTSTSDDYLTSGIAFAFHPHRDTWYSAPVNQINWWLPVYDVGPDNGLAIHPQYWERPLKTGRAITTTCNGNAPAASSRRPKSTLSSIPSCGRSPRSVAPFSSSRLSCIRASPTPLDVHA